MRGTLHDIFPAQLTMRFNTENEITSLSPWKATGTEFHATAARVTVANDKVLLAIDDGHSPSGPSVILCEEYTTFNPSPTRDGMSSIVTASGTAIVYIRDAACGCGSRLRSWNPLRFMQ